MAQNLPLKALEPVSQSLVVDQVFGELYAKIIAADILPGAKLSEIEVAKLLNVSRQPVRDAFYRLSKLGFLEIRPQRATTISLISANAVREAKFVRTALEIETLRVACEKLVDSDMDALAEILDEQNKAITAGDKRSFHQLDDMFHRQICERSGLGFVWRLIQEQKAHMDRVRFLSLDFGSKAAYREHTDIFDALRKRRTDAAVTLMRAHLSTILQHILRIRADHQIYFADEE